MRLSAFSALFLLTTTQVQATGADTYFAVMQHVTAHPTPRQESFVAGLVARKSLESMVRDGTIATHFDCTPQLRIECADAINRVAAGGTRKETVIDRATGTETTQDPAVAIQFLMLSANSRNITLFADDEYRSAIAAGAIPPPELDEMLGDFAACEPGELYDLLYTRDARVYNGTDFAYQSAKLPQHLEAAFVRTSVKAADDHVAPYFTVTGSYEGLKVKGLQLFIGLENGISAATLIFDESRDLIVSRYGAKVEQTDKDADVSESGTGHAWINDGQAAITCDWSM